MLILNHQKLGRQGKIFARHRTARIVAISRQVLNVESNYVAFELKLNLEDYTMPIGRTLLYLPRAYMFYEHRPKIFPIWIAEGEYYKKVWAVSVKVSMAVKWGLIPILDINPTVLILSIKSLVIFTLSYRRKSRGFGKNLYQR